MLAWKVHLNGLFAVREQHGELVISPQSASQWLCSSLGGCLTLGKNHHTWRPQIAALPEAGSTQQPCSEKRIMVTPKIDVIAEARPRATA